ncbi:MAG: TetR/AcrR family transcriptional regulator [Spirochaetales bacterium]|nr:TetR/AcrR family transcriptional regulator [Spirochaetales bacterium]
MRKEIIQASFDLFARLGFEDTTMGKITDATGIPRGTLYEYFNGKEEILIEIVNRYLSLEGKALDEISALCEDDPVKALNNLTGKMIEVKAGTDKRFAPLQQELLIDGLTRREESGPFGGMRKIMRRDWRLIQRILYGCAEKGILSDKNDIPVKAYAVLVVFILLEDAPFYFDGEELSEYIRLVTQSIPLIAGIKE